MEWLQWQDHVTEFEDRYTESKNDDGTITHKPATVLPWDISA